MRVDKQAISNASSRSSNSWCVQKYIFG